MHSRDCSDQDDAGDSDNGNDIAAGQNGNDDELQDGAIPPASVTKVLIWIQQRQEQNRLA